MRFPRPILISMTASLLLTPTIPVAHAEDSVLRIALRADIRSIDPGLNRDGITDSVVMHMVEGLVAYREDTSVGLMLAKSVDISPDGHTYTFKLRDGVHFHNGVPLTADDVLFSWNRYMDPKNNWRCRPDYDGDGQSTVLSVTAPDPMTVVYHLRNPSAIFLATLARVDCGGTAVYHRSSLDAQGHMVAPIGTGPFKFEAWRHGQDITLSRFAGYAALPGQRDGLTGNKTALVDKVRFVVIPDQATAEAALTSGGIDVLPSVPDSDVAQLKQNPDLIVGSVPTMEQFGFLIQTRDPLMQDIRIRQALLKSLDLRQLVDATTNGLATPSLSIIPTPSPYFGKVEAAIPPRDLAGAKALLAAAGYHGQPIVMLTNQGSPEMYSQAILAQQMAREAGINIQLDVMDWAAELDRYTAGKYQILSNGFSARLDPSLSFDMVSGRKELQPRKIWDDPQGLALLAKSMQTTDKAERQALVDQMETLFRADVPMIGLFSAVQTTAMRRGVTSYQSWALGQPRAWGVSLSAPH